jgi:hypothetical protein
LGIFFSCSSSAKLVVFARTNKSAKLITRFNIFNALNGDKPSVFSNISISCYKKKKSIIEKTSSIDRFTDADVALASNGKRPPHALHRISDI